MGINWSEGGTKRLGLCVTWSNFYAKNLILKAPLIIGAAKHSTDYDTKKKPRKLIKIHFKGPGWDGLVLSLKLS